MLRDYQCQNCGRKTERFDDEDHETCPRCGQKTLKRILSPLHLGTSGKRNAEPIQPELAGVRFRVKEGQVMGSVPIVAGEEIHIRPGESQVLAIGPDPDSSTVRFVARKMDKAETAPDKSKMN